MTVPTVQGRCPHCGAGVRANADWCSLCYADLRPKPAPTVVEQRAPAAVDDPLISGAAEALATALRGPAGKGSVTTQATWPCFSCGAQNPLDLDACSSCGRSFAAEIPTDTRGLKAEKQRRLIMALGIMAALLLVIFVVTVATSGDRAPADTVPSDAPIDIPGGEVPSIPGLPGG